MMIRHYFAAAILVGSLATAHAADNAAAEAKLRETLRNTLLQLRTMQGERDTLQVEKTQLEAEKKTLSDKVDVLSKQAIADAQASEKSLNELRAKLADAEASSAQLRQDLDKTRLAYQEAVTLSEKREAARAKATLLAIELQRVAVDQRTKNAEMYRIGMDVLGRFERFGLGTAISAREPFVGTTKVRLENLVQDYSDKLTDQKIQPAVPDPVAQVKMRTQPAPTKKNGNSERAAAPVARP